MRIILISFCLSISIVSPAQGTFQKLITHSLLWQAPARYLEVCSDSGYILSAGSNISGIDIFKTDSTGSIAWMYEFPYACEGYNVIESYDHNFIIAGFRNENQGARLAPCILKLSSSGTLMWSRGFNYQDYLTSSNSPTAVVRSNDSGYVLMSSLPLFGFGNSAIVVIKMDSLGNQIWSRSYGTGTEWGITIVRVKPSGYLIMGNSYGSLKKFIFKIDEYGTVLWSRSIGNDNPYFVYGDPIQQTSDNGYVFFGERVGVNNKIICKSDSGGNMLWSKLFSCNQSMSMSSLVQMHDGGLGINGWIQDTSGRHSFIIKLDSMGNTEWTKYYYDSIGCSSAALTLKQIDDGSFIFSGSHECIDGNLMIVKTDSLGNPGCPSSSIPGFQSTPINNPDSTITLMTQLLSFQDSSVSSNYQNTSYSELSFCFSDINTYVSENKFEPFSFSPNHFHSSASLRINSSKFQTGHLHLRIFNSMGILVNEENISDSSNYILHRNGLRDGMYFFELRSINSELLGTGKFIVE